MTTIDTLKEVPDKVIPSSRIPYIAKALNEVELIEKGLKPSRTAREFLDELRKGK